MNEREIFIACLQIEDATRRNAFLDQACAGNQRLRTDVALLLRENDNLGSFLETPGPENPTLTDAKHAECVGSTIGPYKLLEQIGEGGMGTVYMAEQKYPVRRRVALKLIKPGMDSAQVIARFEAERQALALMDHHNIARVLDGGTTESGRPYFVMELVNGIPITEYCDAHCLTPRARLELLVPVCHAIQHAHQKGIIHRDIKPSNVLITLHDGSPVPKVIDFGVAKAVEQRLTERTMFTAFGQIVGTWEYMSPEQAAHSGLDVDTRSDVYSLGVLAYELLTGSTPLDRKAFRSAAFDEILRLVREQEPPRPSVRLSSSGERLATISAQRQTEPAHLTRLVRGELDWIVMRALEKDRSRRYETASDLARDIERYLNDEPVEACPPSARYRLGKFWRRNRIAATSATLVILALVGGIIGATWGMMRAEDARQSEIEQRRIAQRHEEEALVEKAKAIEAAEQERLARVREGEQRQAAEKSQKKAVSSKQVSDAVLTFLQRDLLLQASGTHQANAILRLGGGFEAKENPTIKELLERAAAELTPEKIERKFPGQKEVQAAILGTVGECYRGIGDFSKAVVFLGRSHELYAAELGANDSATLFTLSKQALALRDAGKVAEAIELYLQVCARYSEQFGPDDPATLDTQNGLAVAYLHLGKTRQGIELLERVREAQSKVLDENDPQLLETLNNLAAAYRDVKRVPEAIELFEQIRDQVADQFGAEHPHTMIALNNLALAYQDARRMAEAIRLFEQVRDGRTKKLGADHPDTLTVTSNLGVAYRDSGKLPQAIKLLEQVREARVKKLGADHPASLNILANLGRAYQLDGKLDRALPLFKQAALGMEKQHFQHGMAQPILTRYIMCLEQMQEFVEAEVWRRKVLALLLERTGPENPAYPSNLASLGDNLLMQKRWAEAEVVLRDSITRFEQLKNGSAGGSGQIPYWVIPLAKCRVGSALVGQKKYADAEPFLLAGYQEIWARRAESQSNPTTLFSEAVQRVVQLYDAWDKKDKADEWRKKLPPASKNKN